jgi:hypothetical protein
VSTACSGEPGNVTSREKVAFIALLKRLPWEGEFVSDAGVAEAAPFTHVMFALTQKDIEEYDLYPFLALSRGLLDRKGQRELGIKHFSKIAHPEIKLAWAAMLFDGKVDSPETVIYLQAALKSKSQRQFLSELMGSKFGEFSKRVGERK